MRMKLWISVRAAGGYLRIFDATGKHLNTLSLRAVDKWVIEPILELPTKRDALVRYTDGGGEARARGAVLQTWLTAFGWF